MMIMGKNDFPIIVSGMENSGTRVVVWILQSLKVDMGDSLFPEMSWKPMDKFVSSVVNTPREFLERNKIRVFEEEILEILDLHSKKSDLWGFKSPQLVYLMSYFLKALENRSVKIKFIHVIRDGRDISQKFRKRAIDHYGSLDRVIPDKIDGGILGEYEKFLYVWKEINLFLKNNIKNLLQANYFRVSLEDIVDPNTIKKTVSNLSEFIGRNGDFDEEIFYKITVPRSIGRHFSEKRNTPSWFLFALDELGFNFNSMKRFDG